MKRLLALAVILVCATSMTPLPDPHAPIEAAPVMLDPGDPAQTELGPLHYLGGWELKSGNPSFGGISAMHVEGDAFIALTDAGKLIRFRMKDGRISDTEFGALPGGPGSGESKADRDSESMAIDPEGGRAWVGFEGHNAIWRYSADLRRAEAGREPEQMAEWPSNRGPEAMLRLRDGRVLVFSEEGEGPEGAHAALAFRGDPAAPGTKALRFYVRPPADFAVTDADQLPDGRVLILCRHFSLGRGVLAAVILIDPAEIAADKVIVGREVARLASPLTVDNMEALSIEQVDGRTIVWIASDDNFSPLQRTILMKFAWEER